MNTNGFHNSKRQIHGFWYLIILCIIGVISTISLAQVRYSKLIATDTLSRRILLEAGKREREAKKNVSEVDRHIEQEVRTIIDKMTSDHADNVPSGQEFPKRYSTTRIKVDTKGRLNVMVVLAIKTPEIDTTIVVKNIESLGGSVTKIVPLK